MCVAVAQPAAVKQERHQEWIAALAFVLTCLQNPGKKSIGAFRIEHEAVGRSVGKFLFPSRAPSCVRSEIEPMVQPLIERQGLPACGVETDEIRVRRELPKAEC